MKITLDIPDELVRALRGEGKGLDRVALDALALEAYRERRISAYQLRTLLGIRSRYELDGLLNQHRVYDYTAEDFEKDLASIRDFRERQGAGRPA